eukprot:gnl/TRDRNA2_/TRDRNA2_71430_c0_seq1.p1 gnl/TRDRNA2_/TRDRNA2_71430_c0~~gnl/TRDRNA2_/TRDRNA2_71430_c0_seq1.p1  ORF type:complete len:401 (-),score=37.14 gnl/TRDRNA2_/TRDRNA2_71430_c0_seq1:140-1342(-)
MSGHERGRGYRPRAAGRGHLLKTVGGSSMGSRRQEASWTDMDESQSPVHCEEYWCEAPHANSRGFNAAGSSSSHAYRQRSQLEAEHGHALLQNGNGLPQAVTGTDNSIRTPFLNYGASNRTGTLDVGPCSTTGSASSSQEVAYPHRSKKKLQNRKMYSGEFSPESSFSCDPDALLVPQGYGLQPWVSESSSAHHWQAGLRSCERDAYYTSSIVPPEDHRRSPSYASSRESQGCGQECFDRPCPGPREHEQWAMDVSLLPPNIPSLGTLQHASGTCRPCFYMYARSGCHFQRSCKFCHGDHVRVKKERPPKLKRQRYSVIAHQLFKTLTPEQIVAISLNKEYVETVFTSEHHARLLEGGTREYILMSVRAFCRQACKDGTVAMPEQEGFVTDTDEDQVPRC